MARTATEQGTQPRRAQRQTQYHASQSQRRRGRGDDEEQADQEEQEEQGQGDEEEDGEGGEGGAAEDMDRRANALVRLALFNESRRMPLRRDEINKRVLGQGGNSRMFKTVLAMAQKKLQSVFGAELVELMTRAERDKDINADGADGDGSNALGLKRRTATSTSKSYILRSTVASELIEIAARANETLLEEEFPPEEDEDDDSAPQTFGTIISWSTSDQLGGLGLLYVILSLILVNGHVLSDPELKKYLKTLRLSMVSVIEFAPHATQKSSSIESYLGSLVKQGFLDKIRLGSGGAPQATQGKRGRPSLLDEESVTYEWRWGARSHAEVGEQAIACFVSEFMAERMLRGNDDEEDDERRRPTEQEAERIAANVMRDITRAAGGQLRDLTER